MKNLVFALLVVATSISGCKKDEEFLSPEQQLEKDIQIIKDYLVKNSINATEHSTGLFYVIHTQGTGIYPSATSRIKVNYEGRLLGKTEVFDSGTGVDFSLQNLITGWQIGFPLLREGASATLYIPSGYAYGTRGSGSKIPANAVLEFDVDLIDVL